MVAFLKSLRRAEVDDTDHLRDVLTDIQQERAAFEALLERAAPVTEQLQRLESDETRRSVHDIGEKIGSFEAQLNDFRERFNRFRGEQEASMRTQSQAAIRLKQIEDDCEGAFRTIDDTRASTVELQSTLDDLRELTETFGDTKHELNVLKAMAEQVGQRTASLEQQRHAIDRAAARADDLGEKMKELDVRAQKQEEHARTAAVIQQRLDESTVAYDQLTQRTNELRRHQAEIDEQEKATKRQLSQLRDDVKQSQDRFDLEVRGLDSASARIADLRGGVKELETGLAAIEDTQQRVGELTSRTHVLSSQVSAAEADLAGVMEQASVARNLGADVDRLDGLVSKVSSRAEWLEEKRPVIDSMLEGFAELGRSNEAVRDGLEQVRIAYAEIERIRAGETETRTWVEDARREMTALRKQVENLNSSRPAVDLLEEQTRRVMDSVESIESRRTFLDEMRNDLTELTSTLAQLDERGKGLSVRIETAEDQFSQLNLQAGDAERVAKQVFLVQRSVQDADQRMQSVSESVSGIEDRAENLERLTDRVRQLSHEVEQRQAALEAASEHLERASAVRQDAADAASRLEEQAGRLHSALGHAETRADNLRTLTDELSDRSNSLGFVHTRLGEFEERLAEWESVESAVSSALEQVAARQETVHALRNELRHMFELAERTVADVRAVTDARHEIQETRESVEQVVNQLRSADVVAGQIEERKRKIDQAETRLSRVEALLLDIDSSMDTLQAQKALVDHVVEKSGALAFQTRQAEGLIDTLRDEREITNRVRRAFAESREEDQVARAG